MGNKRNKRIPKKLSSKKLFIFCEGETEEIYFKEIKRALKIHKLEIIPHSSEGTPFKVVREARKKRNDKNSYMSGDIVWCVFDRDQHTDYFEAIEIALKSKISYSISNPCFELWILLHFQDQRSQTSNTIVENLVKKYIKNFKKGMWGLFDVLEPRRTIAINRARSLYYHHDSNKSVSERIENCNPLTKVYELIEFIWNFTNT